MQLQSVRVATLLDGDSIVELVNAAYRPEDTTAGWTNENSLVAGPRIDHEKVSALLNEPSAAVLVGIIDGATAACILVEQTQSDVVIGMLAVHPKLQGMGIGKTMLEKAEAYALAHFKPVRLVMHVLTARTELLAFYARRGYIKTDRISDYPIAAGVGIPKVGKLQVVDLYKPVASSSGAVG